MRIPDWRQWLRDERICREWFVSYEKRGVLRKDRLGKELYIRKSVHNLDFASWLKGKHENEIPETFGEERFYDWVISACYYSIYHGALALLSKKGYSTKSHSATLCGIILLYFHRGKMLGKKDIELIEKSINKDDIETIAKTKSLRERASYDVSANFELSLVERAIHDAAGFLQKVKEILE